MDKKNDTGVKRSSLGRAVMFASIFSLGLLAGDKMQPLTNVCKEVKYYNLSAEDGTPRDFRNYEVSININEKGRAELYFGNKESGVYRLVNEDGTVGSLGSSIDIYLREKSSDVKNWFDALKDKYSNSK